MMEERPRLGWIVWLAAMTAAAAALWTVATYKPTATQMAEMDENSGQAMRRLARAARGVSNIQWRLKRDDWEDAREDAGLWLEQMPDDVEAHYWASYLNADVPDGARHSRKLARRGLKLSIERIESEPGQPRWHAYHGWFLLLMSEPGDGGAETRAESRAAFDRAVDVLRALPDGVRSEHDQAYDMACYLTMAGREEEAITHLAHAIETGWTDGAWLNVDPDLGGLRDREDYAALMVRMDEIRRVAEWGGEEPRTVSENAAKQGEEQKRLEERKRDGATQPQ